MEYKLRLMQEEHLDRVRVLEKDLFSAPWPKEAFLSEIEKQLAFVLEIDGIIHGYVCSLMVLDESEISNVAVSKDFQNRGFGKILVSAMIDDLFAKGCVRIFLEVRESNIPARKLYDKLGFKILGVRKNYYSAPREDAIVLKLDIQDGE